MTIKEIARECREMVLGQTRTFELPEGHAPVEVTLELDSLQADFTFDMDDGRLVVHRTHQGSYEL